MPLRQRVRPTTLAVATLVGAAVLLAGCGDDEPTTAASTTTTTAAKRTTTSTSTSTTLPASTTSGGGVTTTIGGAGTTIATTPTTTAITDPVPDGASFGYVTAVNVGGSTITIDIAELLTGDAAVKAAIEDGVLEPGETSIDNDYYVRNKNPKLRTAPVAPTAPVKVLADPGSPDLTAGSLAGLATSLAAAPTDGGPRVPVQISATGGTITRIDEVFFP